jgi:hypothetical protein
MGSFASKTAATGPKAIYRAIIKLNNKVEYHVDASTVRKVTKVTGEGDRKATFEVEIATELLRLVSGGKLHEAGSDSDLVNLRTAVSNLAQSLALQFEGKAIETAEEYVITLFPYGMEKEMIYEISSTTNLAKKIVGKAESKIEFIVNLVNAEMQLVETVAGATQSVAPTTTEIFASTDGDFTPMKESLAVVVADLRSMLEPEVAKPVEEVAPVPAPDAVESEAVVTEATN